ncbi:alanine--tRNA ligase [Rickettsiales bacterium]|nr:alanine--tRNA ligase [Rickettsiales bacterium]
MQTVNEIRSKFLEFFKSKGHEVVQSSPLVPHNDPTLMFTNAGMVPFKDVFTQNETRPYKTATSSQKCVRAGGKHNDLDNVGYTARHHTFFEMLGNFSFGDYFKENAIKYAWEFLTEVVNLPADRLLVTIYHTDDEAYQIWKDVSNLPDNKIIRISTNDNFWSMGNTGPCGPCSEIFYDHGPEVAGGPPGSPDEDGDRFIEIWNLVFMQYETLESGEQIDLPAPSIDTGMGLERIAAILQNVHNNYNIDLFENIIAASKEITKNSDDSHIVSHRVIADHLRSMAFLLADGVMPSNEGRGYVLRRIMRRAMRHARQLGCKKPVIYQLVPTLIKEMGNAYPELIRAQGLITEIIKLEEERFGETLDRGLKLLEEESSKLKSGDKLSGETAFKLYDTYGFPLDLTIDILRNKDISVDEEAFNKSMQEQKERARAAWKGSGAKATDEIWFEIKQDHGATEFLGYDADNAQAKIIAIVKDGNIISDAKEGDEVNIILNQTPFYGESGGQEGDSGSIYNDHAHIDISSTGKVLGDLHIHTGKVKLGTIKTGDVVSASIDIVRRNKIRANHSATHLLHAVLRKSIGDHITQKGSLVAEDRFRFDISHPKALTTEEIIQVEDMVNDLIRQNSPVGTRLMKPEDATAAGAMALFGEKYGDEVRVLNMGFDENGHDFSVELCGGTHVKRTGDIGAFKIILEEALASGIRRIEALTGEAAIKYAQNQEAGLKEAALLLKTSKDEVVERINLLLQERKNLEKELAEAKKAAAMGGSNSFSKEEINGIGFIGQHFDDMPPKDLRNLVGDMKNQLGSGVIALTSSFEGKASLIIAVTDDVTAKINAVDLIRKAATHLGAKGGGGKPNYAQTGGDNIEGTAKAISVIKEELAA